MFAARRVDRGAVGRSGSARALAGALPLLTLLVLTATFARPAAAQQLTGGWHAGGPVRASLAAGLLFQDLDADGARGVITLVEPGLRGGRVSLGYELGLGHLGTFVSGRASVLRTWKVTTPRTYTGVELQVLPLFALGGRLGAFVPTQGTRRVLWIADVSLGM